MKSSPDYRILGLFNMWNYIVLFVLNKIAFLDLCFKNDFFNMSGVRVNILHVLFRYLLMK